MCSITTEIYKEMAMGLVQFPGETSWESLIHHESLDIEEEEDFRQFCLVHECAEPENTELVRLQNLFTDWRYARGE